MYYKTVHLKLYNFTNQHLNKFNKNWKKNKSLLYCNNEQMKLEIKNTTLFTLAPQNEIGINLTRLI